MTRKNKLKVEMFEDGHWEVVKGDLYFHIRKEDGIWTVGVFRKKAHVSSFSADLFEDALKEISERKEDKWDLKDWSR